MEEAIVKKEKKNSQALIWWGGALMIAPVIGIVIIFFGWTLVNIIGDLLSGGVEVSPEDPLEVIMNFIKGLLTLGGLLCTFWGLSLSPVGLILLIVGLVKKNEKK